jgi:hypothetical protein
MSMDYDKIRQFCDRSATWRVLQQLERDDLTEEERKAIVATLCDLDDPRAVLPLTSTLERTSLPETHRDAAGQVLRALGDRPSSQQLRHWWFHGDSVVKRHALLLMTPTDEDIVAHVASDATHPMHLYALQSAAIWFDAPQYLPWKLAAFAHPDPQVRSAAADSVYYDEPIAAEPALIRLLADSFPEVVCMALKALSYYPTLRCLLALTTMPEPEQMEVRDELRNALENVRGDFECAVKKATPRERPYLLHWMKPVVHLLNLDGMDDSSTRMATVVSREDLPDADTLIAMLSNPEGVWAEKLQWLHATTLSERLRDDHLRVGKFLAEHPDPEVKSRATSIHAAWNHHETLLRALHDPTFRVRKSAMYYLGVTSPRHDIAPEIWKHLHRAGTYSTHAYETLHTWVVHAPRPEALQRLPLLVRDDKRETIRTHAVYELAALEAREEIKSLVSVLDCFPTGTWSTHVAMLDAVRKLEMEVTLSQMLLNADNLQVQCCIARLAKST